MENCVRELGKVISFLKWIKWTCAILALVSLLCGLVALGEGGNLVWFYVSIGTFANFLFHLLLLPILETIQFIGKNINTNDENTTSKNKIDNTEKTTVKIISQNEYANRQTYSMGGEISSLK